MLRTENGEKDLHGNLNDESGRSLRVDQVFPRSERCQRNCLKNDEYALVLKARRKRTKCDERGELDGEDNGDREGGGGGVVDPDGRHGSVAVQSIL